MIGEHLSGYTYEYLLKKGLADIPDTIDKRQGSVVYDAIASTAKLLAEGYCQMQQVYHDTFAQYALGESLQLRAEENGIRPKPATKALRKGVFAGSDGGPYDVPIASRFSAIDGAVSINYIVKEKLADGIFSLEAEETGLAGNDYLGPILPIDVISGLKTAMLTDILIPASNAEEDESLRTRYFDEKNAKRFGGNIAQYRGWINELDGVGACQVYPVWNGGGTVKICVIDSQHQPLTAEMVQQIQQAIDPTQDGQGLGTAPIGHIVTISTAEPLPIGITAHVQMADGYTPEQLQPLLEAEVEDYFAQIRAKWGTPNSPDGNDYTNYVFLSQVMAAMLRVQGVFNITGLALNGQMEDIRLQEDTQVQQIPVLGVVKLV